MGPIGVDPLNIFGSDLRRYSSSPAMRFVMARTPTVITDDVGIGSPVPPSPPADPHGKDHHLNSSRAPYVHRREAYAARPAVRSPFPTRKRKKEG